MIPAENPNQELGYEDLVKLRVVRKRTITLMVHSGTADAEWNVKAVKI